MTSQPDRPVWTESRDQALTALQAALNAQAQDPAARLQILRAVLDQADADRTTAVQDAREADMSWSAIARALGMATQGAHRKWRDL
jgi:hypothetical protein